MKKKNLAGTQVFWLAVSKNYIDGVDDVAFRTRKLAEHFIDHRVEGWDGWRLVQAAAFAEHTP